VDLHRVERDTKIRSKYLAALEDGEFTELPGDVYARGFLRNYATYLGLDADEIEEEWREEAGSVGPVRPTFVGPQPITMSRRIVLQRSHLVMAMVAVVVIVVGSYFGYQLTRYLSYPTLAVASSGNTVYLPIGTPVYVLRGTATPGTTVLISWNGQDPKTVIVDDAGQWSYQAVVQPGRNQFDITAKNLDTSHASTTTSLIVIVATPTPTPAVPTVALTNPLDGSSAATGSVTVTGTSNMVNTVTLTQVLVGGPLAAGATLKPATPTPVPASAGTNPTLAPGATATPKPQTAAVNPSDGSFTFTVTLTPGLWQLVVVGTGAKEVQTKPVSRTVSVPYKGIYVQIWVKGGTATAIHVAHDGKIDIPANSTEPDGWTYAVTGSSYVCISAYPPNLVFIAVNGTSFGAISSFGGQHARVEASGVPFNVTTC
jgi:hypothetical protein